MHNRLLVDIRAIDARILVVPKDAKNSIPGVCLLRKPVALLLRQVQDSLPKGIVLRVYDGYRSLDMQKKVYREQRLFLRLKHPFWSKEKLEEETQKWVAHPDGYCPHATGATVDLTLADAEGKELDMGSEVNETGPKAKMSYAKLSLQQKRNRQLLAKAMKKAGFVDDPFEWWHWSYGEKEWAEQKKTIALYCMIKP